MQLGTRWGVGDDAPAALPPLVRDAVATVEGELSDAGIDASAWRWTLTWLERRPVVELDDGTRLRVDHAGNVLRDNLDDPDEFDAHQ